MTGTARERDDWSDALSLFLEWQADARRAGPLAHPDAVCLSTADERGVPEARFVDLKGVSEAGFVFCTHMQSRKARTLTANSNAALTFWWDHAERQVRVVGVAQRIPDAEADAIFRTRSRDARVTSWASRQSATLTDPAELDARAEAVERRFAGGEVPRPPDWGGFRVVPSHIEFLSFRANRRHERLVFERGERAWSRYWLQP